MKENWGLFALLRKLSRDEHASILLQFTVYIVAVLGMMGMALDGGRFILLNNSLQDLADAASLAGAAELDGASDAITRADAKARTLLTNTPRWFDVADVQILAGTAGVQFYSSLNPDTNTTDPTQAQFIKVTTGSWQTAPWFVSAIAVFSGGAIANNSTNASAIAGVGYAACVPIQSYMCGGNFPSTTAAGTIFSLLASGSGGSGNWGIMDLPAGLPDFRAAFSALPPAICVPMKVDQRTGNGQHSDIVWDKRRFDQSRQ